MGEDVPESAIDLGIAAITAEDAACLLFTSGSTARSKAAGLVHSGLIDNMHGIGERMHLTEQDRLLLVVSLFWSFACANALFAALTVAAFAFAWRFVPETSGRSLEDIEGDMAGRLSVAERPAT